MKPQKIKLPDPQADAAHSGLLSPAWSQYRTSRPSARSGTRTNTRSPIAIRDQLINNAERLGRRATSTFLKLNVWQRVLAVIAIIAVGILGILFLVFSESIFGWLQPYAEKWKHTTGGWVILWLITFLVAFPPMVGYSTCCTTAGFVYGVWEGWLILATASVAGSTCSFIVSRTLLRRYVERLTAADKRFAALSLTLKHDGLKLLCMIRLCPLPYSFSNGAMSTFPTVEPLSYGLATAIVSPKLLIHAFVGSRLAAIARNKGKMTTGTKAINWISIAVGVTVGACVGFYIYQQTMARAQELEAEEAKNARPATPREYADDPESQAAAETLASDDTVDWFSDDPSSPNQYRDDTTESDDVFSRGDRADEHSDDLGNGQPV